MSSKKWLGLTAVLLALLCGASVFIVACTDPYLHYHAPLDSLWYDLDNQRSQNDGLIRHLSYGGIITGTSMTENFRSTEAEALFGVPFIKVPFSGATYKEINDNLKTAFDSGNQIRYVIRGLDMYQFDYDKDSMRYDLGEYPLYLYDRNPLNDERYVLNKEILFGRSIPMLEDRQRGKPGGMTSFDDYSRWNEYFTFGPEAVRNVKPRGPEVPQTPKKIADTEQTIRENIRQNVTELALAHPETEFYYFFTPYSAAYWEKSLEQGRLEYEFEAQKIVIEEILKCPNIRLFSFNNFTEITTDLNYYKDREHYSAEISSLILQYLHEGTGLITEDNYREYLKAGYEFYTSFDYSGLYE